jgi:hypothetical protein
MRKRKQNKQILRNMTCKFGMRDRFKQQVPHPLKKRGFGMTRRFLIR